jgi:hypothetical protein
MKTLRTHFITLIAVSSLLLTISVNAGGDDFKSVVKMVEEFYGVKHKGLPFLAKAGMKVVGTAARIKGGDAKRLAELGSVKLATFEDQNFRGDFAEFRAKLNSAMVQTWTPLVQTISKDDGEQVYVFVRSAGEKFNVLIVTIEQNEGTVVQANVSSKNMAQIMKDPENAGKTLSQEATITDNE